MIGSLIFLDRNGSEHVVATNVNESNVGPIISSYVKELYPDFKIFYVRMWMHKKDIMYDFGSHSEFFTLKTSR